MIHEALKAGANAYISKSDGATALIVAIEALQQNRTYFNSRVGEIVPNGFLNTRKMPSQRASRLRDLTAREREIVQLVAEGKSTKEVAVTLGVSVKTDLPFARCLKHMATRICGEAQNGKEAIEKAEESHPDLIVLDLSMPVLNGLEAARILRRTMPAVPLILYSNYADILREELAGGSALSIWASSLPLAGRVE